MRTATCLSSRTRRLGAKWPCMWRQARAPSRRLSSTIPASGGFCQSIKDLRGPLPVFQGTMVHARKFQFERSEWKSSSSGLKHYGGRQPGLHGQAQLSPGPAGCIFAGLESGSGACQCAATRGASLVWAFPELHYVLLSRSLQPF